MSNGTSKLKLACLAAAIVIGAALFGAPALARGGGWGGGGGGWHGGGGWRGGWHGAAMNGAMWHGAAWRGAAERPKAVWEKRDAAMWKEAAVPSTMQPSGVGTQDQHDG